MIDLEDIKSKSVENFKETARKRSDIQKWLAKNSLSALKLTLFDEFRKSVDPKLDVKANAAVLEALSGSDVWKEV
jgi:hypothetical protein